MGTKQTKMAEILDEKSLQQMQTMVHGELSIEEIQTWYKTYKESRHSGNSELSKDEFKEVYNGLFDGDATEFSEHVFRTFDLNNDGHVDFYEFLLGLCASGSSDIETKILWAFQVYDIDGDGTITWKEMRNIIQAVCKMTSDCVIDELNKELNKQTLSPSSTHANGTIDADSFGEESDRAGEIADRIFLEMDENKDGTISLEEFREGVMKIPMVMRMLECGPDD